MHRIRLEKKNEKKKKELTKTHFVFNTSSLKHCLQYWVNHFTFSEKRKTLIFLCIPKKYKNKNHLNSGYKSVLPLKFTVPMLDLFSAGILWITVIKNILINTNNKQKNNYKNLPCSQEHDNEVECTCVLGFKLMWAHFTA